MEQKYTKDFLEDIVKSHYSINSICKSLGSLRPGGSSHRWIRKKIKEYNIDTSHFRGKGWSRGQRLDPSVNPNYKTKEEIFRKNSTFTGTKLRRHYIRENPNYCCAVCQLTLWNGKQLKLHLDHVNGICNDNRLENLRWICPNCHQQTETWGWTGSK